MYSNAKPAVDGQMLDEELGSVIIWRANGPVRRSTVQS